MFLFFNNKMKVAVLKCDRYNFDKLKIVVERGLGLIDFDLKNNLKVLIKPNVLACFEPERAVTTHPLILDVVCSILKKKGCEIFIGDSSTGGLTEKALEITEIKKISEKYNANLINFDKTSLFKMRNKYLGDLYLPKIIKDVDLIINIPKLKTHLLTNYTGAIKNLFGFIPGGKKGEIHRVFKDEEEFSRILFNLYEYIKPELNIMDGIIGMEGGGPSYGDIKKTGLVFLSKDALSLDKVVCDTIKFRDKDVSILQFKKVITEIVGEKGIIIPYKKPTIGLLYIRDLLPLFLRKYLMSFSVVINTGKCKNCLICYEHCPVKAIKKNKDLKIDQKKCIKCYCCYESCPYNAIYIKRSFIFYLYNLIRRILKH